MTQKGVKQKRSETDSPLRFGPIVMRFGPERDPRLRRLSVEEAVEEALVMMALSLNLLRESVSIRLKTKDEERVGRGVRKLLAEFDQLGQHWHDLRNQERGRDSDQGDH